MDGLWRRRWRVVDDSLWFGTDGGLTRYRRRQIKPRVHIVSVEADQIYHDLSAVGPIPTGTRIKYPDIIIYTFFCPKKTGKRENVREAALSVILEVFTFYQFNFV